MTPFANHRPESINIRTYKPELRFLIMASELPRWSLPEIRIEPTSLGIGSSGESALANSYDWQLNRLNCSLARPNLPQEAGGKPSDQQQVAQIVIDEDNYAPERKQSVPSTCQVSEPRTIILNIIQQNRPLDCLLVSTTTTTMTATSTSDQEKQATDRGQENDLPTNNGFREPEEMTREEDGEGEEAGSCGRSIRILQPQLRQSLSRKDRSSCLRLSSCEPHGCPRNCYQETSATSPSSPSMDRRHSGGGGGGGGQNMKGPSLLATLLYLSESLGSLLGLLSTSALRMIRYVQRKIISLLLLLVWLLD